MPAHDSDLLPVPMSLPWSKLSGMSFLCHNKDHLTSLLMAAQIAIQEDRIRLIRRGKDNRVFVDLGLQEDVTVMRLVMMRFRGMKRHLEPMMDRMAQERMWKAPQRRQ
jgi:hypothetical protein